MISVCLRTILLLSAFCNLTHASGSYECREPSTQPIAINLGLDAITAVYAHSPANLSVLAGVSVRSSDSSLEAYGRVTWQQRYKYYRKKTAEPSKWTAFLPDMSALYDSMNRLYSVLMTLVLKSGSDMLFDCLTGAHLALTQAGVAAKIAVEYAQGLFAPAVALLTTPFTSPVHPGMQEPVSLEEARLGLKAAFETIKNISRTHTPFEITAAVLLIPDYLDDATRELVPAVAKEAGIIPMNQFSPQQVAVVYDKIFEENITEVKTTKESRNLLVIDYGLFYFDVQAKGKRCKLSYPLDLLAPQVITNMLMQRLAKNDAFIKAQIERGASYNALYSAVYSARHLMKEQRDFEWWEENSTAEEQIPDEQVEGWPIDVPGWATGEEKAIVLQWEDVKAVESEYVRILVEALNRLLMCFQGCRRHEKHGRITCSETADSVVILGNYCDRSLVRHAIQQTMGGNVKIVGADSEFDVALAAQGGARVAFSYHEEAKALEHKLCEINHGDNHEEL